MKPKRQKTMKKKKTLVGRSLLLFSAIVEFDL